ncbi:MAG: serine/threonine protein kinase [Deltaproteobacteria bacterium]|nr:serine/threonine protein kinase [Deltaproteobacteria bacterium]
MPVAFGNYDVHEPIGSGGMATVHRAQRREGAEETRAARAEIALKRLRPELTALPDFVQAFLDEARLARNLRHANIAQTYDFGIVDGTYYIAMELVRGPTLARVLASCTAHKTEMPLPIALHLLAQVCDALEYAHSLSDPSGVPLGIVHRDVSPSNIIVSEGGAAKLIDFGIAKAATSHVRTKTGFIKGKFGYVAPEYLVGAEKRVDARADLFATGVVAFEMLTGRRLFQTQNDIETLERVRRLPIEAPSKWRAVPPQLDEVVLTALQRDPARRWQRAGAMRSAIDKVALAVGDIPTNEDVAAWVRGVAAPRPEDTSDASAVSIEISLIEARPFGENVLGAASSRRRTTLAVGLLALAALAAVVIALLA